MDYGVMRANQLVKRYDRDLYAQRNAMGKLIVMRKNLNPGASDFWEDDKTPDQFILALTDNWRINGTPTEWGYEQVRLKLAEMDGWVRKSMYEEFCLRRERYEEDKGRAKRNDLRALAADVRKDFARATNDIVVQK